ncbi:MAG: hypothetical protein KF798_03335 [Candidatus Paracaedibacteraceae bacterium]|nr:hypothetical protein [Candidatus Paracaedibacteraceae bacterium]
MKKELLILTLLLLNSSVLSHDTSQPLPQSDHTQAFYQLMTIPSVQPQFTIQTLPLTLGSHLTPLGFQEVQGLGKEMIVYTSVKHPILLGLIPDIATLMSLEHAQLSPPQSHTDTAIITTGTMTTTQTGTAIQQIFPDILSGKSRELPSLAESLELSSSSITQEFNVLDEFAKIYGLNRMIIDNVISSSRSADIFWAQQKQIRQDEIQKKITEIHSILKNTKITDQERNTAIDTKILDLIDLYRQWTHFDKARMPHPHPETETMPDNVDAIRSQILSIANDEERQEAIKTIISETNAAKQQQKQQDTTIVAESTLIYDQLKDIPGMVLILNWTHKHYKQNLRKRAEAILEERYQQSIPITEEKILTALISKTIDLAGKNTKFASLYFHALTIASKNLNNLNSDVIAQRLETTRTTLKVDLIPEEQQPTPNTLKAVASFQKYSQSEKEKAAERIKQQRQEAATKIDSTSYEYPCLLNLLKTLSRWITTYKCFADIEYAATYGSALNYDLTKNFILPVLNQFLTNRAETLFSVMHFHTMTLPNNRCAAAVKFKIEGEPNIRTFFIMAADSRQNLLSILPPPAQEEKRPQPRGQHVITDKKPKDNSCSIM